MIGRLLQGCGALVVLVVVLIIVVGVCGGSSGVVGDSTLTIRVTGSPGLQFSGSYLVISGRGSSSQKSVDGTVPAEYTAQGQTASATFQKKSQGSETLRVEILRSGKVIGQAETTASFGVASASAQ